ncbi:hypothetical protein C4571_01485 [Candidatus Parcubacteria bacterium]|nr:MAG: hypothetical protein C4571_01485 [Candidatus Parcubacteria bacterium]
MKVFYAGLRYNYYDSKRGVSFEHENFYESLHAFPGAEVRYFPFERILEVGKTRFNEEILEAAKKERPDILFVFTYSDEFDFTILDEIRKYTISVAWFADDSWRFHNYSKFLAPHFSWAVTTYSWMPELYRRAGQKNVVRSQWAASTNIYKRDEKDGGEEVLFIGGWTKGREKIVEKLKASNISVAVYGQGWSTRRVSREEMIRLFSTSNINLGLNPPPGYWAINSLGRLFSRASIDRIVPDFHIVRNIQSWLSRGIPQIKARHFEIPACGGFLMTEMADDLDSFYVPGKEIVIYKGMDDMIKKIRYYLTHDAERSEIAERGYKRTLRDHTYEKRFREIFRTVGVLRE